MNETKEKKKPEISGKIVAILPIWQNGAGTFTKHEIVIETGFKFPNPIKVVFKNEKTALVEDLAEGDCVFVQYSLDGRSWDGPNGLQYFVDVVGLSLQKIEGKTATTAKAGGGTIGCTMQTAIDTWTKHHGDDKLAFAQFCQQERPDIVKEAAAAGQKFSVYALNRLDVWADIKNRIEAQATGTGNDGYVDDLPF